LTGDCLNTGKQAEIDRFVQKIEIADELPEAMKTLLRRNLLERI
jgi:hypothetical protein